MDIPDLIVIIMLLYVCELWGLNAKVLRQQSKVQ